MEEKSYRIHIRQGEFELDVEGDRAFVEAYAEALLAEDGDLESIPEPAPKRRKKPKTRAARKKTPHAPPEEISPETQALKAFMNGRKVKSNKERYLEYMRFLHSHGAKEVGDRHIGACYSAEGLAVPPTGRQNFGTLRKEGLVKAGSQRGLWALTPAGLEGSPARAKRARGAKTAARKKTKATAKGARKARKKAAPKTVVPAKSPAPRKAAKKKSPRRKKAAKALPKAVHEVKPAPEGA